VRPGDRIENAVVARVEPDAVTLRAAGEGLVRVQRIDAMAELLRPSRSPAAPRPGVTAPGGQQVMPAPGAGPVTTASPAGETPAAAPPPNLLDENLRRARRERRFREQEEFAPSNEPPGDEE
jgi:hypothetical protein